MKEATGELSMTAVVVVVIGILAVALPLIINTVINNMERSTKCQNAFGCNTTTCAADGTGTMVCKYIDEDASKNTNADGTANVTCECGDSAYTK